MCCTLIPHDGEAAFAASVTATFRNIVEDVEVVSVPMDASALSLAVIKLNSR